MLSSVVLLNPLFTLHSNLFFLHTRHASIWSDANALHTNDLLTFLALINFEGLMFAYLGLMLP